jgi:hypothetical protein
LNTEYTIGWSFSGIGQEAQQVGIAAKQAVVMSNKDSSEGIRSMLVVWKWRG